MQKPEDRRIRKTKRLLKQGLCALMQEKDFHTITVKELTDYTDLNRGTFYLHYTDIYDLLEKIEDEVLGEFQAMVDAYRPKISPANLMPILEPVAEYIDQNYSVCKVLFCNVSADHFLMRFQKFIMQNGISFIKESFHVQENAPLDAYLIFISNGITGLLRSRMSGGALQDRQELVSLSHKIITSSATALLGERKKLNV